MNKYHILKNEQNLGPYSLDEIRSRLSIGELLPDDLAWTDGMAEWQPIRTVLAANPVSLPPPIPSPTPKQREPLTRIWNPVPAINWSILFPPLGAFIHAQNAKTLNRTREARLNIACFWFFIVIYISIPYSIGIGEPAIPIRWILIVLFLLIWYFTLGKKQMNYVKTTYGSKYTHKSWMMPLVICFFGFFVSNCFLGYLDFQNGLNKITKESQDDIDKIVKEAPTDTFRKEDVEKWKSGLAAPGRDSDSPQKQTQAQSSLTNTTPQTAGIGDKIRFSDSEWTVTSAKQLGNTLRGGEFSDPKQTAGQFIIVKFDLVNTSKEEEQILETPKLVDGEGRKFNQIDETSVYLPEGAAEMTLEQLPAGVPKTFYAIYEIARDATNLSFEARSLGFNPEHVLVSLGF